MMTLKDYEFLQRIEREKEDSMARRRIVRRQYTREERKRRRTTLWMALLAGLCAFTVSMAINLDNTGDDPTRDLPLQKPTVVEPAEEPPVSNGMDVLGEFDLTAYCPCEECCGQWALNRPDGIVYTASGVVAKEGVTVAVDPDVIPLGTEVYIVGRGWYTAQDTGNFAGNVIDIYMTDHATACEFGRQNAVVAIPNYERSATP